MNRRTIEDLKEQAGDRPAPPDVLELYHRAFVQFGSFGLWSTRELSAPTIGQALSVAASLKRFGNMQTRRLATDIEDLCRAAV